MHAWALIIFFHVGPWGETDSNAGTVVHGFESQELCEAAARKLPQLVHNTKKEVRSVCVQTK